MERQKGKAGKCHVCGRLRVLSLEHIPPRSAFNNKRAFVYGGSSILGNKKFPWEAPDIKGQQHQNGIGFNTLCEECNNNTGSWYGSDFARFANSGMNQCELANSKKEVTIHFQDIYPLRIIKEIVCMFLSINSPDLAYKEPELREFVLNRDIAVLSNKFRFGTYFFTGSLSKYLGIQTKINFETGEVNHISELTFPPFGYVMEIEPKKPSLYRDISNFVNYSYDESDKNMTIEVPILESNTYFVGDYRTKQEIIETRKKNEAHE